MRLFIGVICLENMQKTYIKYFYPLPENAIVKTTICCIVVATFLLPACTHVANRCNMPATKQQYGNKKTAMKYGEYTRAGLK